MGGCGGLRGSAGDGRDGYCETFPPGDCGTLVLGGELQGVFGKDRTGRHDVIYPVRPHKIRPYAIGSWAIRICITMARIW